MEIVIEGGKVYVNHQKNQNKRPFKGERIDSFPSNYVVIDIETTGLDPATDLIIEISAIKYVNYKEIDKFSQLISISTSLPPFITSLTGITDDMLKGQPSIDKVLFSFKSFIGDNILVGHNVHFDINFLYDAMLNHLDVPLDNDFSDTCYLSRKYVPLDNHKLNTMLSHFNIKIDGLHRAENDCRATQEIYLQLNKFSCEISQLEKECLLKIPTKKYNGELIDFVGTLKLHSYSFYEDFCISRNLQASSMFLEKADIVVLSNAKYKLFEDENYSSTHIDKARKLSENNKPIYSEKQFNKLFDIPLPAKTKSSRNLNVKDIVPEADSFDVSHPFYNKHFVFTGTLSHMTRKEAMTIVVNLGGILDNSVLSKTNYLVIGNYKSHNMGGNKSNKQKKAEELILKGKDLHILSEDVFLDLIHF